MARVYAELIVRGLKVLDDVPDRLRSQVLEILENQEEKQAWL